MSDKINMTSSLLSLTEKIYDDDVAHPALAQLGKLIALPVAFLGYPAEVLLEKYKKAIQKSINMIPIDKQTNAKPSVAAPIIEYMKYAFEEDELLEVFTNLLASCIDVDYTSVIHPSFIEKIKQLSVFDLRVLRFISKQLMFCDSNLRVEVTLDELKTIVFPKLYLFTNMQDFNGDAQQIVISIDLLVSLGILSVDRKEVYKAEEYSNRIVAFHELDYKSPYESDLFCDYLELCNNDYRCEYESTLYSHDRFFYSIELSPELENMIVAQCEKDSSIEIDSIASTRRIIKLTSYGMQFLKAVFREDS